MITQEANPKGNSPTANGPLTTTSQLLKAQADAMRLSAPRADAIGICRFMSRLGGATSSATVLNFYPTAAPHALTRESRQRELGTFRGGVPRRLARCSNWRQMCMVTASM